MRARYPCPAQVHEDTRGLVPAEGLLGAARLAPWGPPSKTPAFNVAARRCRTRIFFCRGFEYRPKYYGIRFAVFGQPCGVCRLRDSNPRPTVYKTVALPLC